MNTDDDFEVLPGRAGGGPAFEMSQSIWVPPMYRCPIHGETEFSVVFNFGEQNEKKPPLCGVCWWELMRKYCQELTPLAPTEPSSAPTQPRSDLGSASVEASSQAAALEGKPTDG